MIACALFPSFLSIGIFKQNFVHGNGKTIAYYFTKYLEEASVVDYIIYNSFFIITLQSIWIYSKRKSENIGFEKVDHRLVNYEKFNTWYFSIITPICLLVFIAR